MIYNKLNMVKVLVVSLTLLVFTACNSNRNTTSDNTDSLLPDKSLSDNNQTNEKLCYANYSSKDSMKLQLVNKDNTVTGSFNTKIFGKDENKGTFTGLMKGDTLIADYSFLSEGVLSVRQIAFVKRNNTLTEGYGDVEEKGGKMSFKNIDQLKFDDKKALKIIPCAE